MKAQKGVSVKRGISAKPSLESFEFFSGVNWKKKKKGETIATFCTV